MGEIMVIEEKVGADGKVVLELPPGANVRITVENIVPTPQPAFTPEEEAAADAEFEALMNDPATYTGLGLTMGEIMQSPAIGIWKDREDMADPVAYLAEQRRKRREKRLKRD
jgi:hypothetical protein